MNYRLGLGMRRPLRWSISLIAAGMAAFTLCYPRYIDGELCAAARRGDTARLGYLIRHGAHPDAYCRKGTLPLGEAAYGGRDQVVIMLIEGGADINARNSFGRTALMMAALTSHENTARLLINRGANVNIRSNSGTTALRLAVDVGDTEMIKLLIDAGAID
jgi:ankyrin repeat protein